MSDGVGRVDDVDAAAAVAVVAVEVDFVRPTNQEAYHIRSLGVSRHPCWIGQISFVLSLFLPECQCR